MAGRIYAIGRYYSGCELGQGCARVCGKADVRAMGFVQLPPVVLNRGVSLS
jgi:hypothetical protein